MAQRADGQAIRARAELVPLCNNQDMDTTGQR